MNAWSNIAISRVDPEITSIQKLEKKLGSYPTHIGQIRELITRFEVCHFKYLQHLTNIRKSILDLQPYIDPGTIGQNHIKAGDMAWKSDKTKRSIMGQQYLWALYNWLDNSPKDNPSEYNDELANEVGTWLGERSPDKEKLVRLLVARLKWDWKTLEELSQKSMEEISSEEENMGLEYQIFRMDICHFAYPVHLINMLRGIGEMKPVEKFEGCGIINRQIRKTIRAELLKINDWLHSSETAGIEEPDQTQAARIWLFACLAKTIKEQVGLKDKIFLPE